MVIFEESSQRSSVIWPVALFWGLVDGESGGGALIGSFNFFSLLLLFAPIVLAMLAFLQAFGR